MKKYNKTENISSSLARQEKKMRKCVHVQLAQATGTLIVDMNVIRVQLYGIMDHPRIDNQWRWSWDHRWTHRGGRLLLERHGYHYSTRRLQASIDQVRLALRGTNPEKGRSSYEPLSW